MAEVISQRAPQAQPTVAEVTSNIFQKQCGKLPEYPSELHNLAVEHYNKFMTGGNFENLETAIQLFQAALDKTAPDYEGRAARLYAFGVTYTVKHQCTKSKLDCDRAIELLQEALDLTPSDHSERVSQLQSLGAAYNFRYYIELEIADLDKAIQLFEESLNRTISRHPGQVEQKFVLGSMYKDRFPRSKRITDINNAIQLLEEALQLTPPGHRRLEPGLQALGHSYEYRYYSEWEPEDLNLSIHYFQKSLDQIAPDSPTRPSQLHLLGCKYRDKFSRTAKKTDIYKAIEFLEEALQQTPSDHSDRPSLLEHLGNAYGCRYSVSGDEADIDLSIQHQQQSLEKTPSDPRDRASRLQNLGAGYICRSERKRSLEDLNVAIQLYYASLNLTPPGDSHRVPRLYRLGTAYEARSRMIGTVADVDMAIYILKECVEKTPPSHPEIAFRLQSLGNACEGRYFRKGDDEDFQLAIQSLQKSVEMTAPEDPNRGSRLLGLAIAYRDHYDLTHDREDLDRCIQLSQKSLDTTPPDSQASPTLLSILGTGYALRYLSTRVSTDIEMALRTLQKCVSTTRPDDGQLAFRLNVLGATYKNRYLNTRSEEDLDMAIQRFQSSLDHIQSGPRDRLHAGMALYGLYVDVKDWEKAYQVVSKAVHLVQSLTPRSLENSDKQIFLRRIFGLAADAVAIALSAGKTPFEALQLLELGRGVMTGALSEIRTDVTDLQQQNPEMASEYLCLCQQLDPPPTSNQLRGHPQHSLHDWVADLQIEQHSPEIRSLAPIYKDRDSSWQDSMEVRHDAADKLNKLIRDIRNSPGFEDFLRAPTESSVQTAAEHGPIVVINVSPLRCDALLIEQHGIRSLALPGLKSHEIEEMGRQHNLDSLKVLEWLWDVIADPILTEIGITHPPSGDDWPRIWWIPTGCLSKFPLHAAGRHHKDSKETVLDRVMSSYCTSLKTIIHGRQTRNSDGVSSIPPKALLIAMPETPKHGTLPFAAEEIAMLRAVTHSMALNPVEPNRCRQSIVQELSDSTLFHFAGHGLTDNTDPSQNCLLLSDWESEPLTVGTLLQMNLRKSSPFLAYLSACGTGRVGNAKLVDESIHLISACQLAGFRHVIGTLWEVNDRLCVDIARITYEEMRSRMRDGRIADDAVCLGLHLAIRQVRDRWLNTSAHARWVTESVEKVDTSLAEVSAKARTAGTTGPQAQNHDDRVPRDVVSCDDEDDDELTRSLLWVPYVHFGV